MSKILLVACDEPEALRQRLIQFAQEAETDLACIIAKGVDEAVNLCNGSAADVDSIIRGCLSTEEVRRMMRELMALGFKGSSFAAAEALDLISREKGEE